MSPPVEDILRVMPELIFCGFGVLLMLLQPFLRERNGMAFLALCGAGLGTLASIFPLVNAGSAFGELIRAGGFSLRNGAGLRRHRHDAALANERSGPGRQPPKTRTGADPDRPGFQGSRRAVPGVDAGRLRRRADAGHGAVLRGAESRGVRTSSADIFDRARRERVLVLRSEERRVGKECRSRWSPY